MYNNTPQFTTLLLTQEDKALIGALLKEMSVSQQFTLGTVLKEAEARAKDVLAKAAPEVPEAPKEA